MPNTDSTLIENTNDLSEVKSGLMYKVCQIDSYLSGIDALLNRMDDSGYTDGDRVAAEYIIKQASTELKSLWREIDGVSIQKVN